MHGASVGISRKRAPADRASPQNSPADFPLTESGAAERLARELADVWRHDYRRDVDLLYSGHCWCPDIDHRLTPMVLAAIRRWQGEALDVQDPERRESLIKFLLRLEARPRLENVLALARCFAPVADTGEGWDSDPWLLGVPNGVVDLRTGELRDGRPDDEIIMQATATYDPAAKCERFERAVDEVCDGDSAVVGLLHRAVGYSLCGDVREQVFFFMEGPASTGKTTIMEAIVGPLGDCAHTTRFAMFLHGRRDVTAADRDLAALVGKPFVKASETQVRARFDEERLKSITGGEHAIHIDCEFRGMATIGGLLTGMVGVEVVWRPQGVPTQRALVEIAGNVRAA